MRGCDPFCQACSTFHTSVDWCNVSSYLQVQNMRSQNREIVMLFASGFEQLHVHIFLRKLGGERHGYPTAGKYDGYPSDRNMIPSGKCFRFKGEKRFVFSAVFIKKPSYLFPYIAPYKICSICSVSPPYNFLAKFYHMCRFCWCVALKWCRGATWTQSRIVVCPRCYSLIIAPRRTIWCQICARDYRASTTTRVGLAFCWTRNKNFEWNICMLFFLHRPRLFGGLCS